MMMCRVQWLDSSLQNAEVERDDLPTPVLIDSVGWVTDDADVHVTLTRDVHADGGYRGSVCILRSAVVMIQPLHTSDLTPEHA